MKYRYRSKTLCKNAQSTRCLWKGKRHTSSENSTVCHNTVNANKEFHLHCLSKYESRLFSFFSETISWYFCSVQQMNELAEIKMKSLNVSFIIQQISERLFYIVSITCWRCSKEREAAGINGDFNVCFSVILQRENRIGIPKQPQISHSHTK